MSVNSLFVSARKFLSSRGPSGSRGAAAVEMTIILPLLLLLVFGIVETSILLFDRAIITNASREGARFGIVFNADADGSYAPMTDAQIQAVVNTYLADRLISFSPANATTTVIRSGGSGSPLRVRVEYTYTYLVLPNLAQILANPINLAAETVMIME